MESILSIQDEVYPLRCRRRKSSVFLMNATTMKNNATNKLDSPPSFYQYVRTLLVRRFVYVLGVFNLFLAAIAIVCVTQAEVHPEYFSLVYIAICIFIFYMGTIIFIIVLQIIETYREQYEKTHSSASVEMSLLPPPINIQSNPILIQKLPKTPDTHTRLLRSQTLPSTLNTKPPLSTIPSLSSTFKAFEETPSIRLDLLSRYQQTLPKSYHSFGSTATDQFYPTFRSLTNILRAIVILIDQE
ncbi:unnamed protein product [Adineta ricciae]|uniref:Uncharacterized protein n=3 Tax=Adineta ricciae TaxID=249248 RepID=A0A813RL53_ADIRI|nr:unnamed protein product [Adineta ricciae]CAF0783971.1 unnamed protein product [Adineta ricciae]